MNDALSVRSYPARDFTAVREMGESWKLLTESMPQPKGIDRSGRTLKPQQ
jgi:hypothetical protein